jgi:hypothetical protein
MSRYYDRAGNSITVEQWLPLFSDEPYKRVALDDAAGYSISTVWLGLDHQFGDGPPHIFETMLFGDGDRNNDCYRYSSEAAALAGHERLVDELRGALHHA